MKQRVSIMVEGIRYRGTYTHAAGSLPTLNIAGRSWRGSSLGPANRACQPDASDREYWRGLIRRSLTERQTPEITSNRKDEA